MCPLSTNVHNIHTECIQYIYTVLWARINTHTRIHTDTDTDTHMHKHINISSARVPTPRIHTHTHTHIHTHTHTCMRARTHNVPWISTARGARARSKVLLVEQEAEENHIAAIHSQTQFEVCWIYGTWICLLMIMWQNSMHAYV